MHGLLQAAGGVVAAAAGSNPSRHGRYNLLDPRSQAPALGTSRSLGHSAAQRLGVSPHPEVQAFELTSQDSFLVRHSPSCELPGADIRL